MAQRFPPPIFRSASWPRCRLQGRNPARLPPTPGPRPVKVRDGKDIRTPFGT